MKFNRLILVMIFFNSLVCINADWSFHSEDFEDSYYLDLKNDSERNRLIYNPLIETEYNKGFNVAPVSVLSSFNSTYAHGGNDGAPWQGRGLNGRLEAGVSYSSSWYSILFLPEFWVAQNSDFEIIPTTFSSSFGDYYVESDNLQRFGDKIFSEFNWGQSYLELRWNDILDINISTRNFQFGSSKYNPIIMSNNSKGIPNLNFGTHRSLPFLWGKWEFRMFYGQLNESEFYDGESPDDKAFLSSSVLAYRPDFIPGLSLGVNTLYYRPWSNIHWTDSFGALRILTTSVTTSGSSGATFGFSGTDDTDQVASVHIDWFLPESNFHFYFEWARNDFSGGPKYFMLYPEHTQGLTLGFSKLVVSRIGDFLLTFEYTELGQERDYVFHTAGSWYRHPVGDSYWQGYTNSGQLFGAPIGSGSNCQTIEFTYFREKQKHKLKLNRTLYDNDYFYNIYVPAVGLDGENYWDSSLYAQRVELNASLNSTLNFESFDILTGFSLSYYMNHNYKPDNNLWNFYAQLGVRYYY